MIGKRNMWTPTEIIAFIFVILGFLSLIRWWRMGFNETLVTGKEYLTGMHVMYIGMKATKGK